MRKRISRISILEVGALELRRSGSRDCAESAGQLVHVAPNGIDVSDGKVSGGRRISMRPAICRRSSGTARRTPARAVWRCGMAPTGITSTIRVRLRCPILRARRRMSTRVCRARTSRFGVTECGGFEFCNETLQRRRHARFECVRGRFLQGTGAGERRQVRLRAISGRDRLGGMGFQIRVGPEFRSSSKPPGNKVYVAGGAYVVPGHQRDSGHVHRICRCTHGVVTLGRHQLGARST